MRFMALTAMVALTGSAVSASPGRQVPVTHGLILKGATVVDTRSGKLRPNMAVVIDGARIVEIVPVGSLEAGGEAKIVDVTGKFVVPGYNDMHAHPLTATDVQGSLAMMLANGITGFRQMGGSPEILAARREGRLIPYKDSPELLITPGEILTARNAGTPDAAVAEVDRQKAEGADFIKVVDVPPSAFFAAAAEAKRQGLPFVGHLPPLVNVVDASNAGMHSIEHLGPREGILLGCSSEELALRQALMANAPPMPPILSGPAAEKVMARALANPMVFTGAPEFARLDRELATFDPAKCRALARTFIANDTWQVPTLVRLRTMELGNNPEYRNDPDQRFMPAVTRALWSDVGDTFDTRLSPDQKRIFADLFAWQLKLVKLLDQSGVPMLAGSDYGGGWLVPGFSLHQEFDLLGQAGLSPLHVLQMTTLNAAQFLHREATMGTVEPGKDADLVLLDGNPLLSISNFHRIGGVVLAGVYYSPGALAALEKTTGDRQRGAR